MYEVIKQKNQLLRVNLYVFTLMVMIWLPRLGRRVANFMMPVREVFHFKTCFSLRFYSENIFTSLFTCFMFC